MLDIDALVAAAHGMRRSGLQRFLELDGHGIHIHGSPSATGVRVAGEFLIIIGRRVSTHEERFSYFRPVLDQPAVPDYGATVRMTVSIQFGQAAMTAVGAFG